MSDNHTIESIASQKARLAEALQELERQEKALLEKEVVDAHAKIIELLKTFGDRFDGRQQSAIAALVKTGDAPKARKSAGKRKGAKVEPKYWLPHSGETWTGRGKTPKSFAAWEGTAAWKDWKANHPDEKFPKFPG